MNRLKLTALLALSAGYFAGGLFADEPASPAAEPPEVVSSETNEETPLATEVPSEEADIQEMATFALPSEMQDSAFQHFVDLALVGPAIRSGDASFLTDLALQLAEGERILMRKHKSGVTSRSLLEKSSFIAANQQDKATLERLAKVAQSMGDKDLSSLIANLEKTSGVSRAVDPAFSIPLDNITLDQLVRLKALFDAIREAETAGDSEMLEAVASDLDATDNVSETHKAALHKLIAEIKEELSQDASPEDPLAKLTAASRGWGIKDLDPTNKNSGIRKTGREIDNERLKMMSRSPRPGRDYTKVYFKNSSSEDIWLAVRYVPFEWSSGESTLAVYEPDTDGPFDTHAWFKLSPGERAHVANTATIRFYYYAETKGQRRTWSGNHQRTVGNRRIDFKEKPIVAPGYEEYNINLQ